MSTPSEHKTVQARILGYAEAIGWTFVPREEAEQRCGFDSQAHAGLVWYTPGQPQDVHDDQGGGAAVSLA